MELNEALARISEIRERVARGQVCHGYRWATTAFSGVVAIVAAIVQGWWHPQTLEPYLYLWVGAAVVSLAVVILEMVIRHRREEESELDREQTFAVAREFVPCLVAGGLLTFVLLKFAEDAVWLLPGTWAILFSLGIFAVRTHLPRGIGIVGLYYLMSGLMVIALTSRSRWAMSPWTMISTFGVGQLLLAGFLWWSRERREVSDE